MSLFSEDSSDQDIAPDTVGGRIVRARRATGLSTAQLARRAGVLTDTLQAWESDRLVPRSNQLVTLSGMLNVSPTWLLLEKGESPSDIVSESEMESLQKSLSQLRGSLLTVISGLERIERRLEQYESYH